jgi:hypothetical protein
MFHWKQAVSDSSDQLLQLNCNLRVQQSRSINLKVLKLNWNDALMGNQGEMGPEDKIVLMNCNLIIILESGTGLLLLPDLYNCFTMSYNQKAC